ncbi:MAG: hypothetical protein K8S55_14210, partial [Phycisphaerae bacterium]|nr:hypothetical protein [Phycisphaerae bacterium]
EEKYDVASKMFEAGGPARPVEGAIANYDMQKIGLYIMKVCCRRKVPAWHVDAVRLAKTDRQKLAIKIADTYLHAQRPEISVDIYERFLAGDPALKPITAAVKGYCLWRLALSYSEQKTKLDVSIEYYKRLYAKKYAGLPWTPDAIMCLGVLIYNITQDPHQSMDHYKYVFMKYPNHREAERALYFYALEAVELKNKSLAEQSCKKFLRRYPQGDSGWRKHIEKVLHNEVPKLRANKKGKK